MDGNRPWFYTGVHHPSLAASLERSMLSVNCLAKRKGDFAVAQWILDSGAFTRISKGQGHLGIDEYARQARRWASCGELEAVVQQDWMCEPYIVAKTGLSIKAHQALTVENLVALTKELSGDGVYVMPVIQGWEPDDYAAHTRVLSPLLEEGAWVGVGSVCKRQGNHSLVSAILTSILRERPDLRLHGFGMKINALEKADISGRLWSVDSMAWSYDGRRMNPQQTNSASHCRAWTERINTLPLKPSQAALL